MPISFPTPPTLSYPLGMSSKEPNAVGEPISTGQPRNTALTALLAIGAIAVIVGLIVGLVGKQTGDKETAITDIGRTLVGGADFFDYDKANAAYAGMWFGWIVAIAGVILLVIALAIKAAKA
jgi:hypothetical protein